MKQILRATKEIVQLFEMTAFALDGYLIEQHRNAKFRNFSFHRSIYKKTLSVSHCQFYWDVY